MNRGTTVPLSPPKSTFPRWLVDNFLLKAQMSMFTRKYQPADLIRLCRPPPPPVPPKWLTTPLHQHPEPRVQPVASQARGLTAFSVNGGGFPISIVPSVCRWVRFSSVGEHSSSEKGGNGTARTGGGSGAGMGLRAQNAE